MSRQEIEQAVSTALGESDEPELTGANIIEWLRWARAYYPPEGSICCDTALGIVADLIGLETPQPEYPDQAAYIAGKLVQKFGADPDVFLGWDDSREELA